MDNLNSEQQIAVQTNAKHCLVLAGAGTGKTTTIIARCVHLLKQGAKENSVLIITFTRRAASEIRTRLNASLKRNINVYTGTFHSFAARLMRNITELFDFSANSLIDREDAIYAFKQFIKQSSPPKKIAAKVLSDAHSLAVNTRLPMNECLRKLNVSEDLKGYFESASKHYQEFKRNRNYVDYDDILERLAIAMKRPEVAQGIGSRFKHVLIDEMQDTNPLQWLIVDAVVPFASIYCVGDDAQSIYGFRGADFESIHSFTDRVPSGTVLKLTQNYRSTQEILDLSNWLMNQSPLNYNKELVAARGPGMKPVLVDRENSFEQADFVVQTILDAYKKENRWDNNMILVRSAFQARSIEARLIEAQVPYALIGGVGLLGAKHVKDLLTIPRIMSNSLDELAWIRYLELWSGIGELRAERIYDELCGADGILRRNNGATKLTDAIKAMAGDDRHAWAIAILKCLQGSAAPAQAIDNAFAALEQQLASNYLNDNWSARRNDFIFLRQLAEKHKTINAFVDEYLINPVYEFSADHLNNTDIVKLITIHSAKGLEAKRCFVTDAQPGSYPSLYAKDASEVEEERRVLYVALTRAADELYVCRALRGWAVQTKATENYFLLNSPPSQFEHNCMSGEVEDPDSPSTLKIRF